MYDYDVVYLGSGHACWHGALILKAAGKRVAFVDHDLTGGTCTNYGCNAKILLDSPFELLDGLERYKGLCVDDVPAVDWKALMAYKRKVLADYPVGLEALFQKSGMDYIKARGKLLDAHTVCAGDKKITAEHIVIGTGERAKRQDIPGSEYAHDSREFLDIEEFPKRIVFIGAGVISMEFASMAVKMGSETTVVQYNDRALGPYPKKYVDHVVEKLKRDGVKFCFNESAAKIEKQGNAYKVTLKSGASLECDYVFEATGRQANVQDLGLEEVGIEFSERGIKVNDCMQTAVPNIYASGDVVDKRIPRLTPTASFESNYIAEHILGKKEPICYPAIPNLVFTLPRIAQVGVSLDAAEKEPDKYRVETVPYGKQMLFDAKNETETEFTFIFDKENHLAGAVFYGNEGASLVNFVTFVINQKLSGKELDKMIFAFPTQSYGVYSLLAPMLEGNKLL